MWGIILLSMLAFYLYYVRCMLVCPFSSMLICINTFYLSVEPLWSMIIYVMSDHGIATWLWYTNWIWYGFEIRYNCHNICIHGDGREFRGEKICMVNFITTWYATTRCTVDGSGTCQGPFFYVFLCQGLHGSYGTCDNSLYLLFKEGSHSPCLSSIPLAGYISSMVSLRQSS